MEKRIAELGFAPQKELVYNGALPYVDKLDKESQSYLAHIKSGLGNAVLHHEIKPAAIQWIVHLSRYMKLYGCKFSKDDHLHFIHLLLELLIIPDLEPHCIQNIAEALILLLKKKELLSRDDLSIAWRPIYELYESTAESAAESYGLLLLPGSFENTLKSLIRSCRYYFSVESTQEMLDEWKPKICIFDSVIVNAMNYFELFLCTKFPPHEHEHGYKLWLDEFMNLWAKCQNNPQWENSLVWLLARVARDHIGYINWEPYIPMIFTKILRGFNLPGSITFVSNNHCHNEIHPQALWIISMLGGNSSCQLHINRLFKALESYYHPSNVGRWVIKLQRFLQKLPELFVTRLHNERYKKQTWETRIPDQYKLTDADITEFVLTLKPAALLSIFSKFGSIESASALKNLALLRPEHIVPSVLERMWSSLETVTEPHRLTAAMQCVASMAQSIVASTPYYPEGPTHVLPLLMGALPGIDQNDFKKCIVTLQLIALFGTLMLFVDASKDAHDVSNLTELQKELCSATAAFEDFILQYMDRCFTLVENSNFINLNSLDRISNNLNPEENFMEMGMSTCFCNLLTQCSPDISKSAINKLFNFVSSRIFGIKVSGKYVADMCRSAAKVCPDTVLPIFIPHYVRLILNLTEHDEVLKEENLDEELLFCLLLLSEVVRCDGQEVLKFHKEIKKVLKRTLHLRCKDGYTLACSLLRNTLKSFTMLHPIEFCSVPDFKNRCRTEPGYTFIHEWGKSGDIYNLGLSFHIPNDEEIKVVQEFFDTFLIPELEKLHQWSQNKISLTREELLCSLQIVFESLNGATSCLPAWPQEQLRIDDSAMICFYNPIQETGIKEIDTSDGKNVRLLIYNAIKQVLNNVVTNTEDDIKSVFVIIRIYHTLLFNYGVEKDNFESKWKTFHMVKKVFKSQLVKRKQYIRQLLVERVNLQHQLRLLRKRTYCTEIHKDIMNDIFKLSISHYAEVRHRAQIVLQKFISSNLYCYQWILPDILQVLSKDPNVFHEEFKGVLYVLMGKKSTSLLLLPFWNLTRQLWPAVISSMHSEKQSIVKLFDYMVTKILKSYFTQQLELNIPAICLDKAKTLWNENAPKPALPPLDDNGIKEAIEKLKTKNATNKRLYLELLSTIGDRLQNGNLHWQHYNIGTQMLLVLLRYDIRLPASLVQLFVQHLVHDTVAVRKTAILAMTGILRQQKRKHPKKELNPTSIPTMEIQLHPLLDKYLGETERPTKLWLQYNSQTVPTTEEKWNNSIFIHKKYIGFNSWPKPLLIYEDDTKQPKLNRTREELSEEEQPLYDSFTNPDYVGKLIKYLSLEEKKGQEKFDIKNLDFFRGLFRNFGDIFLTHFWNHLEKLVTDTQESSSRCAAEIIAGLIQGSKHWNFHMMESLKEKLVPFLKLGFQNVHPETLAIWASCIKIGCDNRDPNKYYWFYELFFEKPHSEEAGSFLDSSWLYFLRMAISQQSGRMFELHHRFMVQLLPQLNHSYHNVRDKLGRLLDHIFAFDVPLEMESLSLACKRSDYLKQLMPNFTILENNVKDTILNEILIDISQINTKDILSTEHNNILPEVHENKNNTMMEKIINNASKTDKSTNHISLSSEISDEKKAALNLLQTVCKWITCSLSRTFHHAPLEFFQVLPVLCAMQVETDEEIQTNSFIAITFLAHMFMSPEGISEALLVAKSIANSESWHSRISSVTFLKVMVSSNLFPIMHNEVWIRDITELILKFLHDVRVEVREATGETLGGLLHCEVLKVDEELLALFKSKCQRKLERLHAAATHSGKGPLQIEAEEMIERHAGVLGLCACINAFPYEVPQFMPDILVLLGEHLNDPQPIPSTIKKTLNNFRRTHYDNWRDHQLKFTDDQLAVITDLLVSPSYYA